MEKPRLAAPSLAALTSSAWPGRSMFNLPVLTSQTLRVLSLLPLTSSLLSADQATWYTEETWPRSDMRYLGGEARVTDTGLTPPSAGQKSVLQSFNLTLCHSNKIHKYGSTLLPSYKKINKAQYHVTT